MNNYIIIAIIAVASGFGIHYTIKHFKGQGGCCGGNSYKPKKKKLKNIKYKKTFKVDGMHCEHCKYRVEEAVNDIHGISGTVNLKNGELTVSYAQDIDDEQIKTKIERLGYTVSGICK